MANDDRRGALKALAVAGGAVVCGALGAPAVKILIAPVSGAGSGSGKWIRTVRVASLAEGEAKKVAIVSDRTDAWLVEKNVELGAVWLVRRGEKVDCYSVTCPHLGCAIDRNSTGQFFCPCHDSAFAPDGKRLSGPSPRDLDRLETKIDGGFVLVDFRRFRQGTQARIEIG